jgi:hypothetical protein
MADLIGQLSFSKTKGGVLELVVPAGTTLSELARVHKQLDAKILPHISPRGCAPCLSGIPYLIREDLSRVAKVDLKTGVVAGKIGG